MNEKYVIDKIKEIEEAGATPKEHTHTVSDISDMPSTFTPAAHNHAAGEITSGTLDAARIPALTSDKIPNLDASKITSGVLDVARIPDISGNIVSQLEGQFAPKTETDAVEARVMSIEEVVKDGKVDAIKVDGEFGEFGEIYIDNISSMNVVTLNDGYVGALKFETSQNLTVGTPYTYKANPICNDITFSATAKGYTNGWGDHFYARTQVTVNGTVVLDTGSTSSSSNPITKTNTVTLKEGDIINSIKTYNSGASAFLYELSWSVSMSCSGYLVSNV